MELYVSNEYILQMFLKCKIYFLFILITLRWKVGYIYPLYNGSNALSDGSKVNIFINVSSNMTPELASFESWENWWKYISINASIFAPVILYKNTMTSSIKIQMRINVLRIYNYFSFWCDNLLISSMEF